MALSFDGHASGGATGSSTVSATLTTSLTNDVIVVIVSCEGSGAPTVSSIASGSLSYTLRKALSFTSNNGRVEIWWAVAASALSATSITATLSASADAATMVVFGVNGANTSSPWDTNASLPATATGSASIPTVSGVSTDNANTILIGACGGERTGSAVETAGTGFTLADTKFQNGTSQSNTAGGEYKIVSATQSSISVAFGTSLPNGWGMIADAIVQASATVTQAYGCSMMMRGV